MCAHDYGQGPCERHFACAGCGELLRRKGDVEERAAITASLDRTRQSLEAAKEDRDAGAYGAPQWVARHERLEIDLITMLAVDDNATIQDGDLVRVFPDNPKRTEGTDAS
jgi:hypothetical protein